jgi:hypothetical protein
LGAVVGSIGGLFAIGLASAIMARNIKLLFTTPLLSMMSWVVSLIAGWFIGGFFGPALGKVFGGQRGEIIGGVIGGLVPVLGIGLWGWYLARGS